MHADTIPLELEAVNYTPLKEKGSFYNFGRFNVELLGANGSHKDGLHARIYWDLSKSYIKFKIGKALRLYLVN